MAIFEFLTLDDVRVIRPDIASASGAAFVTSANAQAAVVAPAILEAAFLQDEARVESLKTILRSAVLRWDDLSQGNTALTTVSRSAGPLSESQTVDSRQPGGLTLWPSEEARIRDLVASVDGRGAFTIATVPLDGGDPHRPWCSVKFGSAYCSCGAILTNFLFPLYEE